MIFLANSIKQIKNVGILYKIKSKLQIKHKVNQKIFKIVRNQFKKIKIIFINSLIKINYLKIYIMIKI